jgi:hypothetical protein
LAGFEASVEVLERLLQPDLRGVQLAHRDRQSILGEVVGLDAAGSRDEIHRADRGPIVPVREHVDMCVRHAAAVEFAGRRRELAVAQASRIHEVSQGVSKCTCALSRVDHGTVPVGKSKSDSAFDGIERRLVGHIPYNASPGMPPG